MIRDNNSYVQHVSQKRELPHHFLLSMSIIKQFCKLYQILMAQKIQALLVDF